MGHRVIINLILCLIFGTTVAFIYNHRDNNKTLIEYELASSPTTVQENIIKHTGYTVSYNIEWRLPNWVAYELTAEEVAGTFPRENDFQDDPLCLGEAEPDDYTNSGYDRGHMAPAGDMKWSEIAMKESFYMTNICPQNHNLNSGDWKDLEEHIRRLATKYNHIYICCGPIIESKHQTIGKFIFDPIIVPDAFFKVLLRQQDSMWISVGFRLPNKAGHKPLSAYAISVNDLEKQTAIDFFYNLPDSIEEIVEDSYTLSNWDLMPPQSTSTPKQTISKTKKESSQKIEKKEEPIIVEELQTEEEATTRSTQEEIVEPLSAEEFLPIEAGASSSTKSTSSQTSSYHDTYNGHTVYTGPRGGRYYYNSKGNKVYIKR